MSTRNIVVGAAVLATVVGGPAALASELGSASGSASHGVKKLVHPCHAIAPSVGAPQGTAGSTYFTIRLRNASSGTCTLEGYPVVSFTTAEHDPLGGAAGEMPKAHGFVTLTPDAVARATLQVPDPGNFPRTDCHARTTTYVRVRTKADPTATFVPLTIQACTTTAGRSWISPIH
jgi:hypothetical protein